jgi:uncharacterized lipoprotein YehR (DUF1307 family)
MKKNKILVIIICLLLLCGCGKKEKVEIVNTSNKKGDTADNGNQNINVNGTGKLDCTREGEAINGLSAEFHYYVIYKDGILLSIHSIEKVSGDNKSVLDQYEDAYKKIKENYKDIKYYDMNISRDEKSVTNDTNINYEKVDIDKIIKIEGTEKNIFNDKKQPTLKKWLKLGETVGITCEGVLD